MGQWRGFSCTIPVGERVRTSGNEPGEIGSSERSYSIVMQSETKHLGLFMELTISRLLYGTEVHLDRKLERTLAMLIRLREFRQPTAPA